MPAFNWLAGVLAIALSWPASGLAAPTGNVIFIHPDGTGYNAWAAARLLGVGPDGLLHWDRMSAMGTYRAHQRHALGSTSNAGATAHAYGVKAEMDDYGIDPERPFDARSGYPGSLMQEALAGGIAVGVINSGHLAEPGTGVFLASAANRWESDTITARIIESGAPLILGGGERLLLPEGVRGHFGEPGLRKDGRNLVEEARAAGYTVVYDREGLLALPPGTPKVLGLFAPGHTFNALEEEELAAQGLPLYATQAPTLQEMTAFALAFFEARGQPFFLVIEEEGTDNFANSNNARGMLNALGRADAAIGTVMDYISTHPDTLLVTAADTDAGGLQVHAVALSEAETPLPATRRNGAPVDGAGGTGSLPFIAAPDQFGQRLPFAVSWAAYGDVYGGVIARAHGLNAERLPANVDNTDIYRLMYLTLFGRWLP